MSIASRLARLDKIGVGPGGAVNRLAWSVQDAACAEWFGAQARELGMRTQRDPAGNLWGHPGREGTHWAAGSHLDSVRGGGRYDGPLGVACAFELAERLGGRIAVISFADEEGARFNTPTFGSKALTGRPVALDRRDEHGITIAEAMRAAGVDPERIDEAPGWLGRLRGFVEIHIDQSTDVARAGVPVGIVSALAHRIRLEVELHGRADHAGTTPPGERRDALLAAAELIVAANELGGSVSRIEVEPNASTTIAAHAKLWIDARSQEPEGIDAFLDAIRGRCDPRVASRSAGAAFDPELRARLRAAGEAVLGRTLPELVCFAGHDAGVLAEHVPAAMLLVRNQTGVSHSPHEQVDLADAEVAVEVAARALEELA